MSPGTTEKPGAKGKGKSRAMSSLTTHEQAAYDLGVQHAKNAASWIIDGNTPRDHIERMVAWLDDGDGRADDYLPRTPNLSGEFADDPTPLSLSREILGDGQPDAVDALCEAYEQGVSDTFMAECERILRAALES